MRNLWIVLLLSTQALAASSASLSPGETIEKFYRQYLNMKNVGKKPAPKLAYSKGFAALIAKNKRICDKKAQGDVCGFGADADPFLDAQDFDDGLTFENSDFKLSEPKVGEVAASFNLFPVTSPADPSRRTIVFKMIQEKRHWVVDDISYSGHSARKSIEDEIETYQ